MQPNDNRKEIIIELQGKKIPNSLLWVVGIMLIVFFGTGIQAIRGKTPYSLSHASGAEAPEVQPGLVESGTRTARSKRTTCLECGVIYSIREVETHGEGSLSPGNQFAGGHGKDLAMIVGAASGDMDEGEIEKRSRSASHYDITVHMDNGSSRLVRSGSASEWHTGDQVKVIDGAIHSN
jgi:outer membrane lipoprotein SlyB